LFFSEEKNQKTFIFCACQNIRELAGNITSLESDKGAAMVIRSNREVGLRIAANKSQRGHRRLSILDRQNSASELKAIRRDIQQIDLVAASEIADQPSKSQRMRQIEQTR
jgi:hypothetical protein